MPPEDIIPVAGPPPAGVAVADAAALLAHNNQLTAELATARARVVQVEQADKAAHKTAAISAALAGAPLVNKAAAAQLTALLEKDIQLHTDPATGRQVAVGPGLVPAQQYIQGLLQGNPDFMHFVKAQNPMGGVGGIGGQSVPTGPASAWGQEPAAPQNLTQAAVAKWKEMRGQVAGPTDAPVFMNPDGSVGRRELPAFGLPRHPGNPPARS